MVSQQVIRFLGESPVLRLTDLVIELLLVQLRHPDMVLRQIEEGEVAFAVEVRILAVEGEAVRQIRVFLTDERNRRAHIVHRGVGMPATPRHPRRVIAEVRCPEVAGELIAEVNIEDGVHQPGVRNQAKGINPAFRHRLRGAERHADVIGVFAEPAAEGDLDAARAAGFQKVDECRKEPNADFIGAAPVIGIPDRQEQPFFFRGLGQQVGECVDADGIIAAFFDAVEDSVPVLKACAVPAAFNP